MVIIKQLIIILFVCLIDFFLLAAKRLYSLVVQSRLNPLDDSMNPVFSVIKSVHLSVILASLLSNADSLYESICFPSCVESLARLFQK